MEQPPPHPEHRARLESMSREELIRRVEELERRAPDPPPDALAEAGFPALLDDMSVGMLVQDGRAAILYANRAATELLGLSIDQLAGRSSFDPRWNVIRQDGSPFPSPEHPVPAAIAARRPVRRAVMGVHNPARGERVWLLVDATPHLDDAGEVRVVVCTFSEITDQKRAEERLRLLAQASRAMATTLDYETMLQGSVRLIVPDLADWCSILLREEGGLRRVATAYAYDDRPDALAHMQQRLPTPADAGVAGRVLHGGQVDLQASVDDGYIAALAMNPSHAQAMRDLGTTSMVRAPLVARGRVLGQISLAYGRSGRRYDAGIVPLIEELAHTAALAIDNAHLYTAARRRLAELTTVQRVAQVINSATPLDSMFQRIVETINLAFGYEQISLYLREGESLHLQAAIGYSHVIADIPISQGVSGRVARTGSPAFVRDASGDTDFLVAREGTKQAIIVPLKSSEGAVLGTLAVESTEATLGDDDLTILTLVADQISVAVLNARLFGALRDSEGRYRAVVDQAADAILQADAAWRVVDANASAAELFGRPRDTLLGMRLPDLCRLPAGALWPPSLGAPFEVERGDGSRRPVEASVSPRTEGHQVSWIIILRDIAERVRAEELQRTTERQLLEAQRLESLAVLAGGIAHDFNNLLMVIAGNTSLAALGVPEDSPLRPSLQQIETAVRRATELTQQMLAYAGKARVVANPVSITALVAETALLIRSIVGRNIAVVEELAPDVPTVLADSAQLRRAVLNLVTNAVEAIGDEPGTITLRTGHALLDRGRLAALGLELAPGAYAVLTVADSGPGIDPALRQRIFEPFFSTKFTGRGLGLSAVHGIVRSHGGALHVESDVGAGAAFSIFLPTTGHAQAAPPPPPEQVQPRGAVLVVDDERAVLTIAARMLAQIGVRTITAESGAEALAALHTRAGEIAAVLVDLTMPQMSGAELFGAIQRTYPSLPVVLMSGYTAEEATSHFGPQTPAYFLQKPFTLAALRAAFTEVLAGPAALRPLPGG